MFDEIALRLLDVLERGDEMAQDRAMKALAQIGPDAAIAVHKMRSVGRMTTIAIRLMDRVLRRIER
jgi:electron transfer flavoprotein alpha/beta subunit